MLQISDPFLDDVADYRRRNQSKAYGYYEYDKDPVGLLLELLEV